MGEPHPHGRMIGRLAIQALRPHRRAHLVHYLPGLQLEQRLHRNGIAIVVVGNLNHVHYAQRHNRLSNLAPAVALRTVEKVGVIEIFGSIKQFRVQTPLIADSHIEGELSAVQHREVLFGACQHIAPLIGIEVGAGVVHRTDEVAHYHAPGRNRHRQLVDPKRDVRGRVVGGLSRIAVGRRHEVNNRSLQHELSRRAVGVFHIEVEFTPCRVENICRSLEVILNLVQGEAHGVLCLCLHLPLPRIAEPLHQGHQQQPQQDCGNRNHHQQLHQREPSRPHRLPIVHRHAPSLDSRKRVSGSSLSSREDLIKV